MNDADLFDEYAKQNGIGVRFDGSQCPQPVADEYGRYRRRVRSMIASALPKLPGLPAVYADFVEKAAFNARAFKHKGRYFIAIFNGIPFIVSTLVFRMLADDRLFKHIGDPNEEVGNLPLYTRFTPNAARIAEAKLGAVAPKNTHRQIYALHLCNFVFDFLAAHELAHIAHGHVGYRASECGSPYVCEASWVPDTPNGSLELQAMEMDADFSASLPVVTTVKRIVSDRAQLPQPMSDLYQDAAQAIFDMGVAVCVLFRLKGDSRITGVDLSKECHPPDRWRQMMILNAMGNYVGQFWDSSLYGSAEQAFTRAIAEVENAFEWITGSPQQVEGLHDVWHVSGWNYAEKIAACWNDTLRPKLKKYAFAELSPYGFDLPKS